MIAGIVLDDYKIPVYTRYLKAAGYTWEDKGHLTEDSTLLHVHTTNPQALHSVLQQAEAEVKSQGTKQ